MPIWVDADACPKVIKEILYRAADREKVVITFVANQRLSIPASPKQEDQQVYHSATGNFLLMSWINGYYSKNVKNNKLSIK